MNDRPLGVAVALVCAIAPAGCRAPAAEQPASGPPPPVTTSAVPHGDHNPHHGGVVMMKDDLHYEVVLDPTGKSHQLFFTDAVREDLPASIASSASLAIQRLDGSSESIPLRIDDAGESWIGSGKPVKDPGKTTVRVSFTIHDEPYSIDVQYTP